MINIYSESIAIRTGVIYQDIAIRTLPIPVSISLALCFRAILPTSLKCPNFQRAITPAKFN